MILRYVFLCLFFLASCLRGESSGPRIIETNNLHFDNAPTWLTQKRLEAVTQKVQDFLQWDIRKITVTYHATDKEFNSQHNLNFLADGFFRPSNSTIHLGPRVNDNNFERIMGHELVHAIFFQKYKGAIPKWLEEGLANYIGRTEPVNYAWLAQQPRTDVTKLNHPTSDPTGSRYHYTASTALIDMIASKCSLSDLLQLSVKKKMETYLSTYCEIRDLNRSFSEWVAKNASSPPSQQPVASKSDSLPFWKQPKPKRWWEKKK